MALASRLAQLQGKAFEATRFVARHGCEYSRSLVEKNKKYVVEPPTIEKCQELSKQLLYTRLASYGSENHPVSNLSHLLYAQGKYVYVDGDGSVPTESAKADGFDAVARVGVAADHRGIICSRHVFRIVQHWLHAKEPDPFYDPLNDYVILPTLYDIDKHCEKHGDVKSVKEDWEIISQSDGKTMRPGELPPMVSTLTTSREGKEGALEEAQAMVVVHPEKERWQHVEVRAVGVSHGG